MGPKGLGYYREGASLVQVTATRKKKKLKKNKKANCREELGRGNLVEEGEEELLRSSFKRRKSSEQRKKKTERAEGRTENRKKREPRLLKTEAAAGKNTKRAESRKPRGKKTETAAADKNNSSCAIVSKLQQKQNRTRQKEEAEAERTDAAADPRSCAQKLKRKPAAIEAAKAASSATHAVHGWFLSAQASEALSHQSFAMPLSLKAVNVTFRASSYLKVQAVCFENFLAQPHPQDWKVVNLTCF
ncbi:hypothetical protein M9H77_26838 [Catharanthus roseus]|uniref:Uncharacterized protein n=1 Tax=Catharanthus roseus TaxID=4058 RepID=A0ACC0AB17_CATRO|nr:hypothetical protein M9H77_26838 [Catharanthus roseus]